MFPTLTILQSIPTLKYLNFELLADMGLDLSLDIARFVLLFLAFYVGWTCVTLFKNIRAAKSTGLKYVIVPWHSYGLFARLLSGRLLRLASKVVSQEPNSVSSWRVLVTGIWPLRLRHAPFVKLGTDTFLIVSPGGIVLNTADAEVVWQITSRAKDFPKPDIYRDISIYGVNVVTAEGDQWRHHRRLTSPAFSEDNNELVFTETIGRTQAMINVLLGPKPSSETISHLADKIMCLSLEIIGPVIFGQKVEPPTSTGVAENYETQRLKDGHTMTYYASLRYITSNVIFMATVMAILPVYLLRRMPVTRLQKLNEAYDNFMNYMKEMITKRKIDIAANNTRSANADVLGKLVDAQEKERGKAYARGSKPSLTDAEVMGNLFMFIVAGHETSASSLNMTIILLALHPHVQRQLQQELADILQGRLPSVWDFRKDLPRLLDSILTAVWYEELRLVSPVLSILKTTTAAQELLIEGQASLLPPGLMVRLCLSALHVNPKYWLHGTFSNYPKPTFRFGDLDNDLEEYNPQRWIKSEVPPRGSTNWKSPEEHPSLKSSASIPTAPDTTRIREPAKASFIPFSDGQRSCLGRRFAQIEITAALSVIFSQCSVELAVDDWVYDHVGSMPAQNKQAHWDRAASRARRTWQNELTAGISVQLKSDAHVPLRFVRQGHESFFDLKYNV